jgi:hypothetical protein
MAPRWNPVSASAESRSAVQSDCSSTAL